eukprot:TRINITY_DN18874_c1_g1_i1.p1 TRINITY_DN18874_c1_g1~~TRINITY_DN18874_c1_g1_i1.p1  ORF type:complete len:209 (+),score=26.33 TRINITY_DN18874_c1_g1_i1:113-739(+)
MDAQQSHTKHFIIDIVCCAFLMVLAGLSLKQDFMQIGETDSGVAVYSGSVQEMHDSLGMLVGNESMKSKVRATLAGISLVFVFSSITIIFVFVAFVSSYDKVRKPLMLVPWSIAAGCTISGVASLFLFTELAKEVVGTKYSSINPHVGFICCLLQPAFAFTFLFLRCFCVFRNHPSTSTTVGHPQTAEQLPSVAYQAPPQQMNDTHLQ